VEEQPADELAGRVETFERAARAVEHARPLVHPQAAEGERDPAGDRERGERRLVDRHRPVGLRRRDPLGALAVLDRGVEVARHDGAVELAGR
jgi:hypothetical protein